MQRRRGIVCPGDGQPKQPQQEKKQERRAKASAHQQPVKPVCLRRGRLPDGHAGDLPGPPGFLAGVCCRIAIPRGGQIALADLPDQLLQLQQPGAMAGADACHRCAQLPLQQGQVQRNAPARRFIQEIHCDDEPRRQPQQLLHQDQISLQTGAVADDKDAVRCLLAEIGRGDRLVAAAAAQGIGPWQVDQAVALAFIWIKPLGLLDCFAGPVAGVLA